MAATSQSRPRGRETLVNTLLMLGSVLFVFLALEMGGRIVSNRASLFAYPNFIEEYRGVFGRGVPTQFDPELGYMPRANYAGIDNLERVQFTFDKDSLRLHHIGKAPKIETPPILVTGDSYAQGGEVEDNSSWPAHLQLMLDRRVLNAGSGGYGFDQSVLRGEKLVAEKKPGILLAGFIPDDIDRSMMKVFNRAAKPYFVVENGKLVLKGVPVPVPAPSPDAYRLDPVRRVLGHPYLVDLVMRRTDNLNYWYGGQTANEVGYPNGGEISCLLTDRLKALKETFGVRVILVAQYAPDTWAVPGGNPVRLKMASDLIACAKARGLEGIDTADAVRAALAKGSLGDYYINAHMNGRGNKLTADVIVEYLRRNPEQRPN